MRVQSTGLGRHQARVQHPCATQPSASPATRSPAPSCPRACPLQMQDPVILGSGRQPRRGAPTTSPALRRNGSVPRSSQGSAQVTPGPGLCWSISTPGFEKLIRSVLSVHLFTHQPSGRVGDVGARPKGAKGSTGRSRWPVHIPEAMAHTDKKLFQPPCWERWGPAWQSNTQGGGALAPQRVEKGGQRPVPEWPAQAHSTATLAEWGTVRKPQSW